DNDFGSYKKKQPMRALFHEFKFLKIELVAKPSSCLIECIENEILKLKDLYCQTADICKRMGMERGILRGL
ncbi:hypothetical protein LJC14_06905, partial [Treponema sp. OttesenSCG-928-L16]|nr:hypothetical protein [Treponema sp. OttesenSCG-928-L16]